MTEPAQLVITDEAGRPAVVDVPEGTSILGRAAESNIQIVAGVVSARHATFHWDGATLRVADLGSTNGTTHNGTRVTGWVDLSDGDTLVFGNVEAVVRIPARGPAPPRLPTAAPGSPRKPTKRTWRNVFISYASEDRVAADAVTNYLHAREWNVFLDHHSIAPGEDWMSRLSREVMAANAVVVLISPQALQSEWVKAELSLAVRNDRPVLVGVLDATSVTAIETNLGILVGRQMVDLTGFQGQLAPDDLERLESGLHTVARGVADKGGTPPGVRSGTLMLTVGIVGLLICLGWMAVGMLTVADAAGGFFDTIAEAASGASIADQSERSFAAWRVYADAIVSLIWVVPLAVVSLVLIVAGVVKRRSARRRALMNR